MARILGTGNATLDVVLTVDGYPQENDELRCIDRSVRRGGNTANTLVVLAQLGHACSWAGTLVDSTEGKLIRDDLEARGVDTAASRLAGSGSVPVSTILLNAGTGSRTIIHFRDLPEYSPADFSSLDLQSFDWLHFEGRNVESLQAMLYWSRERYPLIPCSLEIEKPRAGIENLFGLAQVLLFSQAYAASRGYKDPSTLLQSVHQEFPHADLFCSWGVEGAVSLDREGKFTSQAAYIPRRVIDTLGAGDTFNAGVIDGYLARRDSVTLLRQACMLAGKKCGRSGFDGLAGSDLQGLRSPVFLEQGADQMD
jgi:ketohexokinase